jgi:hypothetical protein
MLVVSGAFLVLFTWLTALALAVTVGLLPALVLAYSQRIAAKPPILRSAIWWGFLTMILFVLLINQLAPLHSTSVALPVVGLVLILGVPGWWLFLRRTSHAPPRPGSWPRRFLAAAALLAITYLAVAALGPVTNYDSGLYHLGAIRYAAEFPTVPGLANLYFPLGYATAQFPLAALMGNGPWQHEGMRLINGLVLVLAVADLWSRSRSARRGPGFFVLMVGILAISIPLVVLSDYWVTSPTQDASVLILTAVLTAYFAQAVAGGRGWVAEAATAFAVATCIVILRPTMIVYAAAVVAVLGYLVWHRRAQVLGRAHLVLTSAGALIAIVAVTLRDRALSGWIQFPLSIYGFDVPWRSPDPLWSRAATLGYHRNPHDLWGSVDGWAWIEPWAVERFRHWETYEIAALLVGAVVICWVAIHRVGPAFRPRALAALVFPSILGVIFWFAFTPPAYRFAWGILFSLGVIPVGWSLWLLARVRPTFWVNLTMAGAALPIIAVTLFSCFYRMDLGSMTVEREWRLGPISLPYLIAPITTADVEAFTTDSGLTLLQPTGSDQCWTSFPLCTPEPSAGIRLRGSGLESGFLP